MHTIERLESEVRAYCRMWPAEFATARGAHLYDADGKEYIDFFAGAGVLNYGHNEPGMKAALIDYLQRDGIVHSLDMYSTAKEDFLRRFEEVILKPRGMEYKVQFPGPTGTNAVEAALKLARKVTGRDTVIGFTNAFHGMTLGSLAVTGNEMKRKGAGVPLGSSVSMPYDGFLGDDVDTIDYLEAHLEGGGTGVDAPAAIIVETVQAEGGIHTASMEWIKRLSEVAKEYGALFIVDDIQAGCGRTGPFFSFEAAGIEPDIICLSKSLSGFGLPMAITLIKPEHDIWDPGEHNGTFRGHNAAFVTATEALRFWVNDELSRETERKGEKVGAFFERIAREYPALEATPRGRGLIRGLHADLEDFAVDVAKAAFKRGVIMETSGPDSEVAKILPPLTIDDATLDRGLAAVEESITEVLKTRGLIAEPAVAGR